MHSDWQFQFKRVVFSDSTHDGVYFVGPLYPLSPILLLLVAFGVLEFDRYFIQNFRVVHSEV